MTDETNGKLDEVLEFAKQRNDNSLQGCLDRLKLVDDHNRTETRLFTDFAPYSFAFSRFRDDKFCGNGGIIFHGKHDNGGDGGSPTFSVNLTPTNGWAIHT